MSPERDDYQDDDERDEFASHSIFSAGWFRAVLVLTVLAIVVVISLPYLLNWFEPAAPARVAKPAEPPKPAPSPTPPLAVAPAVAPAPSAPSSAAPELKPAPPVTPPPAPAPKAAIAPAPKPVPEKTVPSAPSEPARKAAPEKASAKAAPEKTVTKAPAEAAPAKATSARPPAKAADKAVAKPAEKAAAKPADKTAAPTRVVAKADTASRPVAVATAKPSADGASGSYWIQLGAFKDPKNADVLAKTLRDAGFPVQVAPIARSGGGESKGAAQQHELFVTDASIEKVNAALKGRGTARAVSGGVAVKPAFSLQEAMTVSKRLTDDGLKVVIRPAGGLAAPAQGLGTLHAVRAGGYPNRTSALAARDELAAKGHQGFLAEGPAK